MCHDTKTIFCPVRGVDQRMLTPLLVPYPLLCGLRRALALPAVPRVPLTRATTELLFVFAEGACVVNGIGDTMMAVAFES